MLSISPCRLIGVVALHTHNIFSVVNLFRTAVLIRPHMLMWTGIVCMGDKTCFYVVWFKPIFRTLDMQYPLSFIFCTGSVYTEGQKKLHVALFAPLELVNYRYWTPAVWCFLHRLKARSDRAQMVHMNVLGPCMFTIAREFPTIWKLIRIKLL